MAKKDLDYMKKKVLRYRKRYQKYSKSCLDQYKFSIEGKLSFFQFHAGSLGLQYAEYVSQLKPAIENAQMFETCFDAMLTFDSLENDKFPPSLNDTWKSREYSDCTNVTREFFNDLRNFDYSSYTSSLLMSIADQIPRASECILALDLSLSKSETKITEVMTLIESVMVKYDSLIIDTEVILGEELKAIESNRSLFKQLSVEYSEFKISKLTLGKYINDSILTSNKLLFGQILSKVRGQCKYKKNYKIR